jgi:hypothetical protein
MNLATWYVMEDGSVADPSSIAPDDKGVLRHVDGRAVAYAPHGPRTRSVEVPSRDPKPVEPRQGYLTRDVVAPEFERFDHNRDGRPGGSTKPADASGEIAALRAEYTAATGKKPFPGWDAADLRKKIAASKRT